MALVVDLTTESDDGSRKPGAVGRSRRSVIDNEDAGDSANAVTGRGVNRSVDKKPPLIVLSDDEGSHTPTWSTSESISKTRETPLTIDLTHDRPFYTAFPREVRGQPRQTCREKTPGTGKYGKVQSIDLTSDDFNTCLPQPKPDAQKFPTETLHILNTEQSNKTVQACSMISPLLRKRSHEEAGLTNPVSANKRSTLHRQTDHERLRSTKAEIHEEHQPVLIDRVTSGDVLPTSQTSHQTPTPLSASLYCQPPCDGATRDDSASIFAPCVGGKVVPVSIAMQGVTETEQSLQSSTLGADASCLAQECDPFTEQDALVLSEGEDCADRTGQTLDDSHKTAVMNKTGKNASDHGNSSHSLHSDASRTAAQDQYIDESEMQPRAHCTANLLRANICSYNGAACHAQTQSRKLPARLSRPLESIPTESATMFSKSAESANEQDAWFLSRTYPTRSRSHQRKLTKGGPEFSCDSTTLGRDVAGSTASAICVPGDMVQQSAARVQSKVSRSGDVVQTPDRDAATPATVVNSTDRGQASQTAAFDQATGRFFLKSVDVASTNLPRQQDNLTHEQHPQWSDVHLPGSSGRGHSTEDTTSKIEAITTRTVSDNDDTHATQSYETQVLRPVAIDVNDLENNVILSESRGVNEDFRETTSTGPETIEGHCKHMKRPLSRDGISQVLRDDSEGSHQALDVLPVARSRPATSLWTSDAVGNIGDRVDTIVNKYLSECRDDSEYWHQIWLRKARKAAVVKLETNNENRANSIFRDMRPLKLGKKTKEEGCFVDLSVESLDGGKLAKPSAWTVPFVRLAASSGVEVPDYSHYVSIKCNFLAHNETVLQHWPYFGDEFDLPQDGLGFAQNYFLDITGRQHKLECMLRAERYAAYAEDMLKDAACDWSDILRFLLEPLPDVGADIGAREALQVRDSFCDEEFARTSDKWSQIVGVLPPSEPDTLGRAALLCQAFQRVTGLRLWHIARRSRFAIELAAQPAISGPDALTCRICMRHNCPLHGEIHECDDGDDPQKDESPDNAVVETDIIVPPAVNFRHRVEFPVATDTQDVVEPAATRRSLKWWLESSILWRPEDRPPYYPCSHPGETCSSANCLCFRNNVPCEKMCSCERTCPRKWQGCSCSKEKLRKGQKLVCFEDDRCACYGLNRECDPDLCGACGVGDVLDPLHRHENAILTDRCNNANIQRGIAKRTLLGTSGVHGFGLYAGERIQEHDFVGEYRGEIITKSESARRGAVYEHQKLSYVFSLNKSQDIDSTYFGNKVRFINHANSRSANLYPRIMIVNLIHRIGLFGSRTTKTGEELLFNYGPEFPEEQLGGAKSVRKDLEEKGNKSAPRVRNPELTRNYFDVVIEEDDHGNRRAVKMAEDGRTPGNGKTTKARERSATMQTDTTPSRKKARGREIKPTVDDDSDDDESLQFDDRSHTRRSRTVAQAEFDGYLKEELSHALDVDVSSAEDDDFHPDEDSDSVSEAAEDDD